MERHCKLSMATALKTKKGYSMLEMLVCVLIISTLMLLTLQDTNRLNIDHYSFLNNYLIGQSSAMADRQKVVMDVGIYFNTMGHVNHAKTIDFNNHSIIIHLGSGYATID